MFDLYHEVESSETTRPEPSRLYPEAHVISRGVTLYVYAEHWTTARVSMGYAEDLQVPRGDGTRGSPLTTVRVRVMGNERSPFTTWEAREDIESCRIVSIAMALTRNEVHGETRRRFIYDLIWASLRDNPDTHEWLRKHFPHWAEMLLDEDFRPWPATHLKGMRWSPLFPNREGWWWFTTQTSLDATEDEGAVVDFVSREDVEAKSLSLDLGDAPGVIDEARWKEEGWRCCPVTYMGMRKKRRRS